MTSAPISDDLLRLLAEDALVVLRWAMQQKMKRPQQVEETVKAFKKRLADEPEGGPRESGRLDQSDGALA